MISWYIICSSKNVERSYKRSLVPMDNFKIKIFNSIFVCFIRTVTVANNKKAKTFDILIIIKKKTTYVTMDIFKGESIFI